MKTFVIDGIDCDACVSLINMDLADAGFSSCVASRNPDILSVPDEHVSQINKIKEIVDNAGHYKLLLDDVKESTK